MAESVESLGWDLVFDLKGDGLTKALKDTNLLSDALATGQKRMIEFEAGGKRLRVSMEDSTKTTHKLREELDGVSFSLHSFSSSLAGVSVTAQGRLGAVLTTVQQIGHALVAGFRALDEFGDRAISANADASGTLRAYTALLGDRQQAEVEFYKASQLSQKTDLTASQVEGAQKSLMVAGFRGQQLDSALAAVADLGAMAGPKEREMMVERSGRALSQIFSKGKLQGEELRQLAEAGISRKLVLEELQGGKYGKDAAAVEKSISKGKIGSDEGIAAIERALLKQFGTSKLGQFATGSAGTLAGIMSNRDEARQNLLKSYDAELLPGMEHYKEALKQQVEIFDRNTVAGRQMAYVFQDLTNQSAELKAVQETFVTEFLTGFASSYKQGLTEIGLSQSGLKDGFVELRGAAKDAARALAKIGDLAAKFSHPLKSLGLDDAAFKARAWLYGERDENGEYVKNLTNKQVAEQERDWEIRRALGDSANGKGEVGADLGGGAAASTPWGAQSLKKWGASRLKAAGGAGSSGAGGGAGGGKGGGGSGGGGVFGNFVPDYSGLSGGVVLPMTAPTSPSYQVELQRALTSSMAQREEQRQAELKQIIEEVSVTIQIDGTGKSSEEIAAKVKLELLQSVGRLARTVKV